MENITSKTQLVDDIIIQSDYGVITESELENSISVFMSLMHDSNDLYKNGHKSFNSLLMYLYKHNIKSVLPNTYKHDYVLLDDIFINIYIPLTYRFNRIASISNYCILVNIDYSLFYDIKTGMYRSNNANEKVNINTSRIVKKWISICDGELIDNVMHTGNVGGMFVAKTRGFREEQNLTISISDNTPQIDAKGISELAKIPLPGDTE